jgi:DNA-binding CsgD family transcriptional regulator
MANISPADERRNTFFELVNALDEALADARRWPAVKSVLLRLMPLHSSDLPGVFPSADDLRSMRQLRETRAWSATDRELLQFVCLRLDRAVRLREKMAASKVKSRAAERALDYVSRAVVLVDKTGKVLMTNAVAESLLEEKDGLCMRNGSLTASTALHDSQLRRSIDAIATGLTPCLVFSLRRPSLRRALTLVFTKANAMLRADDAVDLVLVLINDPERRVSLEPSALTNLYGLTRSEANLACRLAGGENLEQAAAELEITSNTARTHLKRIFMKTDTNRQSQLMVLLVATAGAPEPAPPAASLENLTALKPSVLLRWTDQNMP